MKATLWRILNNNLDNHKMPKGIMIPKIQRDYAQGRKSLKAEEIREVFLSKLLSSILAFKNNSATALDLDFVYGTNEQLSFVPLDGQQRLTTLYLLHLYLAFKEESITEFAPVLTKFTYEIRPSSAQFIKCLCRFLKKEEHNEIFLDGKTFDNVLKNENWYYTSWNYDNTIQGIIVMLDKIHETFKNSSVVLADLTSQENPCITFNFLQLDSFGLTDSLYIKMNSRGKPLTSFENLKAELSRYIKESDFNTRYSYELATSSGFKAVSVYTYFLTKVDTLWSDYFWKFKNEDNEFDNKFLNLLGFVSLNELMLIDKEKYDIAIEDLVAGRNLSYYSLNKNGLIGEKSLINYIDILDILSTENESIQQFFETSNFLNEVVIRVLEDGIKADYKLRIMFYGVFRYLIVYKEQLNLVELIKWKKLLDNLTNNTNYYRSEDFLDSLLGINKFLAKYRGNVSSDLIANSITGFDTIQIKEEKIKHHLKLKSTSWITLIDKVENHMFLNGQIISVLVFSDLVDAYDNNAELNYDEVELATYHDKLENVYKVFCEIFDERGLIHFESEEFRRALLTFGDYALYSTNWFFYNNSNHRDLSWKRLLKEVCNLGTNYKVGAEALIGLFSSLTNNEPVVKQFGTLIRSYIATNVTRDWKYYFIKYPVLFKSCKQHYVKFLGDSSKDYIYCLSKTKYNKYADPDYMSLVLQSELIKKNVDVATIEFRYLEKYEQYGISKINGKSVQIVYNINYDKKFSIKVYGQEVFKETKPHKVVNFIIANYFRQ